MQPVAPRPVRHHSAGELVDDLDLAVLANEVLLVADEAVPRRQRLGDQLLAAALSLPEAARAAQLLEPVLPAGGEVDAPDGSRAVDNAKDFAGSDLEVLRHVVVADVVRADEKRRRVELGDVLTRPVGGHVQPPGKIRPVHQDHAQRQFVGTSQ